MDDPSCDERLLLRTLAQFRWMNLLVSRYRTILTRHVLRDMAREPGRSYHLVDLGAGGCDMAVWLLREAGRRGLRLRVTALDGDPRAVAFARRMAGATPNLTIACADIFALPSCGPADYLFSNHVAHHLPDAVLDDFFQMMDRVAGRCWIVSDLRRSLAAYAGFQLLGRCFRDSFTFEDGKRSIRRGFTPGEFAARVARLGFADRARITTMLPGRILAVVRARSG